MTQMQTITRVLPALALTLFCGIGVAHAQTTPDPANTNTANEGRVTFGVVSFLQYDVLAVD